MRVFLIFIYSIFHLSSSAQNVDSIFSETVKTVIFGANGGMNGGNLPVVELNKASGLSLTFDDFTGSFSNFSYTIEQCDRDWLPSKLTKMEYLEGLSEDRITNFKNSQATNIAFINYQLTIPNEVMRWNKSGNYILKIFEDNADKTPVLTRRFVVVEPIVIIEPQFAIPIATKFNSHHEIDFRLDPKTFRIPNPVNDIRATILQNARWDIAKTVAPRFVIGDKIDFDYQETLLFPAGKEWRYVDLRSTRFRSERVATINNGDDTWEFILRPDLDRSREPYLIYPDLNGGFQIETQDYRNQGGGDARTQAELRPAWYRARARLAVAHRS